MKHLRRNRTTSLSSPSPSSSNAPSVSAPIHLSATSAAARAAQRGGAPPETPLYARFTGARRGEDGSALKLKPLVSGPIALAPKRSATQVPAPPPLQQQKSSEGREERRKQRELDRAKSKAALKEGKEGLEEQAAEGEVKVEVGGQSAERPEVARMRSDETTVSGTSGSTTGLGRHGTRIEGERVLLPARKVTQKRVVADKSAGVEGRGEEAPGSSSKSADAPPMAKGEELQEGGDGPRKEQTGVRPAVGERVPLPARKVTRKRIFDGERHIERDAPLPSSSSSPNNRPTLESSRAHSPAPASSNLNSNSKEADAQSGRANNEVQKQTGPVEHARTQTRTRTNSPEPQASSSSPIVFPANASPIPSPAAGLSATNPGAVVVIDQEGGEDKFSRPKRARMHTLATTSPASNTERPMSPSRPAIEPSKSSEGAKTAGSTAPPAATSTSTSKPAAAPTLTSHPSTSSVATTGGPPRRRKYSLRAAFGLPIARSTSDSHTSTAAAGASTSNTHHAKDGRACRRVDYVGGAGSSMSPSCRPEAGTAMTCLIVCTAEIKGRGARVASCSLARDARERSEDVFAFPLARPRNTRAARTYRGSPVGITLAVLEPTFLAVTWARREEKGTLRSPFKLLPISVPPSRVPIPSCASLYF
ncbi:hypothetical protein BV20DRAFT_698225 [Pilatotrama ljubarskyi]|nr:hypothetical protein BV20DRAFT_698225 [Pilatotrama ljubarskyi]